MSDLQLQPRMMGSHLRLHYSMLDLELRGLHKKPVFQVVGLLSVPQRHSSTYIPSLQLHLSMLDLELHAHYIPGASNKSVFDVDQASITYCSLVAWIKFNSLHMKNAALFVL